MKLTIAVLILGASALWGQPACTNATLEGDYGFTVTGTRPSGPPSNGQPAPIETVVGVAMTRFDGYGNITQTDNIHGSISGFAAPDRSGSGAYAINSDCTGTMTLTSAGGAPTLTLRIVVVDNGKEVRTAVVEPSPVMVTSNGRRVSKIANHQQEKRGR